MLKESWRNERKGEMKVYESTSSPMVVTKTRLLKKYPWYGVLIQRLQVEAKPSEFFEKLGFIEGTITCTDGRTLFFNEEEFDKLKPNEQLFLVAQQVFRCVLLHFSRRGSREKKRWNIASGLVCNGMLVEEKMGEMPKGEPYLKELDGLSVEQVYEKLRDMGEDEQPKGGKGGVVDPQKGESEEGDGGGDEGQGDMPSNEQLEMGWKVALEQTALQMKRRGLTSSGMDRVLEEARKSKTDWRDRVRQLLTVKGDSTWSRPNRRYIGRGMYLPSIKKSKLGHIVFAIDTSGSIDEKMLSKFAGEINEILGCADEWPERVSVIWADAQVLGVDDQEGQVVLRPRGGGGTAFQPTFDWISKEEWEPQVLFYLTDMCGDRPKNPSSYPVVWVAPEEYKDQFKSINWGELVLIEGGD